jgi:hypothetical protein
MDTKDQLLRTGTLEEWRERLNRAIIKSDFNLSNPEVVDISDWVDIMVLDEMRKRRKDAAVQRTS